LRPDFHKNLGLGFDERCAGFLRVKYEDIKRRTLEGGTDEEILRWCFQNGRELDAGDILIWNEFMKKRGWNDEASALLASRKNESGLSDKHEILTMIEYFEFDEGRKA
jgi:gluconokinase